jgi:hypothetical protein
MLPATEPLVEDTPPERDGATAAATPDAAAWSLPARILFRFGVIYFSLYILTTQMLSGLIVLPVGSVPDVTDTPWAGALFRWIATHVFHVQYEFITTSTGSGDRTADWIQALVLLVIAAIGTAAWSALTRRREHRTAQKWFWILLRFGLGSTLVSYGAIKAIPLQMPAPFLTRLLEPYASFSPMGVLWASIGSSRAYEIFVGTAELAGGALLFVPQLWVLGALVSLADAIEVFTLNMTYDVPVKLFSFHLVLMALFLLAPEMRRLADVIVFNRSTGASRFPALFRSRRALRLAAIAQIVFGAYLVGMNLYGGWQSWHSPFGGGAPKPALYGIWDVDRMWIDGVERSPLVTDYDRWRRVIFQFAQSMSYQRMNDTFGGYPAKVDEPAGRITLTSGADKNWKGELAFTRAGDAMTMNGTLGGHAYRFELRRVDHTKFQLLSRGFHWIQERPFNR